MTQSDKTRKAKIYYWTILTVIGALSFGIIVYFSHFYDRGSVNKHYFQPFSERHYKRFGN